MLTFIVFGFIWKELKRVSNKVDGIFRLLIALFSFPFCDFSMANMAYYGFVGFV